MDNQIDSTVNEETGAQVIGRQAVAEEAPTDPSPDPSILTVDKGMLSTSSGRTGATQSMAKIMNGPAMIPTREITRLFEEAKGFAEEAKSGRTRKAYRSDWNKFTSWCESAGTDPLPASPEVVAAYVAHLAELGRRPSTIDRALVAISQAHKLAGIFPSPTASAAVRETVKGIKRKTGTAPQQVSPLVVEHVQRIVEVLPDTMIGIRDRALLLLGFSGAFRRSEVVDLDVEDIEEVPEGLKVTLRRSKTDQEGRGHRKGIPYGQSPETCPVRAWRAWMEASGITSGAIFRPIDRHGRLSEARLSAKAVALVVKRAVERAGYDPKQFSGHSLRAGLATAAAAAGKSERSIMKQTGHRSERMVREYIRDGELFTENAADGLL